MPLNESGVYYLSKKFEEQLIKCLAKYLRSKLNKDVQKYHKKICELLCGIEIKFYKQHPRGTGDLQTFARVQIVKELAELDRKYQQIDDGNASGNWTLPKSILDDAVKNIWKIWCNERERCPRVGVILLYISLLGTIEILLTRYTKNDEIQLGFPKGKMEYGEDLIHCMIREANEEVGLDRDWLYTQLKDMKPVKKNIFNQNIKEVVEHYYYTVQVPTKEICLQPNGTEIEGCEWHNIFTVECSKCSEKDPIAEKRDPRKTNYFMVNCNDRTSLVLDIVKHVDKIKGNDSASKEYIRLHQHST